MNENTILRTVSAAKDLHRVPGFDPMKYLRRAVNEKGEPVMRLELRYQRLWFRLACPQGRMLLNPLRLTDQLAIFEAKVFFRQDDDAPASSFTANKSARETSDYIRAAQDEALKMALDNAGFGIQLCDVTQTNGDGEPDSSALPSQAADGGQKPPTFAHVEPIPAQKAPTSVQVKTREADAAVIVKPSLKPAPTVAANASAPISGVQAIAQTEPAPANRPAATTQVAENHTAVESTPVPTAQAEAHDDKPAAASEDMSVQMEHRDTPVPSSERGGTPASGQTSALEAVLDFPTRATENAAQQQSTDAGGASIASAEGAQAQDTPGYTDDMSVEDICRVMTLEQARSVVVTKGTCKGWTMGKVAEQRPSSLRFYLSGFASQCGNIQLAAATLLNQDLQLKKAG